MFWGRKGDDWNGSETLGNFILEDNDEALNLSRNYIF